MNQKLEADNLVYGSPERKNMIRESFSFTDDNLDDRVHSHYSFFEYRIMAGKQ